MWKSLLRITTSGPKTSEWVRKSIPGWIGPADRIWISRDPFFIFDGEQIFCYSFREIFIKILCPPLMILETFPMKNIDNDS